MYISLPPSLPLSVSLYIYIITLSLLIAAAMPPQGPCLAIAKQEKRKAPHPLQFHPVPHPRRIAPHHISTPSTPVPPLFHQAPSDSRSSSIPD